MSFVMAGAALVSAGVGVYNAVQGKRAADAARIKEEEARVEMEKQRAAFEKLDTSNPYLGLENMYQNMENTMEDLTVNKQAAEFERQQQEQQRANILQSMRGAAGSSGIAALAQTLANQGSLDAQKASASIAEQEQANQQLAAQEASRIQQLERRGEAQAEALRLAGEQFAGVQATTVDMALQRFSRRLGEADRGTGELKSREMEAAKINSLLALSAGDVQGAQALAQQGMDAMSAGIQQAGEGVLQAGTSIADRIEEE